MPAAGSTAPVCVSHSLNNERTSGRTNEQTIKSWAAPLNRVISLNARDVTFKVALDRIAAAGNLRLSYSADLLPLDKAVCISFRKVTLGDALSDLLRGIDIAPVVASGDQVVLAPNAHAAASETEVIAQPLIPLQPVVATANISGTGNDQGTFAFSLLNRRQLSTQPSVSAAMNALVPGVWSWQSPAGFTSLYSVRGASSFGASSPKVFIDGIEVANPLIVAQIAPENIERIEMIRGPQGAALYGADALSGVTNIVTRHESAEDGAPRVHVRSGLALSASDYAAAPTIGKDQTLSIQLGSRDRSGALNFGLGETGAYMPGGYTHHASFDSNYRLVGARSFVTATARLFTQRSGNPGGLMIDSAFATPAALSIQQYTIGARASYRTSDRVTNSLVMGVDGFALGDIADSTAVMSPTDSILRAAGEGALRTTLRLSTVARLATGEHASADLTVSAEHSGLHQYGRPTALTTTTTQWTRVARHPNNPLMDDDSSHKGPPEQEETYEPESGDHSRSGTGVSAQIDAALFDRLALNGGLRIERDAADGANLGTAALPMVGASYAASRGDVSLKLRASYGKGVRWPEMTTRIGEYGDMHARVVRPTLAPEQQSGIEAGIDLMIRGTMGLQITHYNQTASGLQQTVLLGAAQGQPNATYAVQSVGEIGNRGWEMQAFVRRGALSLTGTMSLTDSRVLRIAQGYTGDLQPGDRMLAVPARTMGLDASWLGKGWSASFTAARAFDWINYDRVSLITQSGDVSGAQLRNYWQSYNGFTHLRTLVTTDVARRFTLILSGDNLLGKQVGEPDNLTAVPGRTVSVGVRAAF